jgi:hypothetical protein
VATSATPWWLAKSLISSFESPVRLKHLQHRVARPADILLTFRLCRWAARQILLDQRPVRQSLPGIIAASDENMCALARGMNPFPEDLDSVF